MTSMLNGKGLLAGRYLGFSVNDRFGELQYLSDIALVEKVFTIDAGLRKEAGVEDFIGGAKEVVDKYVLSQIDTSSTGSFLKSFINLLAPAMLFRMYKPLGILASFGPALGLSMTDIWGKVVHAISPKLESGQGVTPAEVNNAAMILVSSASVDLFEDLRGIVRRGELVVTAQQPTGGYYLMPPKHKGVLERVFGGLSQKSGKRLLAAFVAWFIKTILASAGLLVVGGMAVGTAASAMAYVSKRKGQVPQQKQVIQVANPAGQAVAVTRPPPLPITSAPSHSLKSSGAGEQQHANNESNAWVIPVQGDMKNTLFLWAIEIYPELNPYKNLVYSSSSFNRIANMLSGYLSAGVKYLVMPANLHTRKQIVDLFAAEVANKIPKV